MSKSFEELAKAANDRADAQYVGHPEDPYGNGYIACLVELGLRPAALASPSVEEQLKKRMDEFHASLCPTCHGTGTIHRYRNGMSLTLMCPTCTDPDLLESSVL